MSNPYSSQPDYAFWRRAVSGLSNDQVDPVVSAPFRIDKRDKVATAGSCFAQHIAKFLMKENFNYFVTEAEPQSEFSINENFGVFPARFGNIYTVRQLLQLFTRAYGLFEAAHCVWQRNDGAYVDPYRPQIQAKGFASAEGVRTDGAAHLACVRKMFEQCNVFVFTLGLTEAWHSKRDGAAFPLAPGVVGVDEGVGDCEFINFSVEEMTRDLRTFIGKFRKVNPTVRIILTVSPVPLIATYENRHVLVSTVYSKSALRVVAEEVSRSDKNVAYFPSYEIITGTHNGNRYFEPDLRSIKPEGVENVMALFQKNYLTGAPNSNSMRSIALPEAPNKWKHLEELQAVICDEEAIEQRL